MAKEDIFYSSLGSASDILMRQYSERENEEDEEN
jgi:hypothetical protein